MDILQAPNPILNRPTKKVGKIDNRIMRIASEMTAIMQSQTDPEGVGIAANQVGLNLSMFVMQYDPNGDVMVCINPKIMKHEAHSTNKAIAKSKSKSKRRARLEGCLSIKNVWGKVDRSQKIILAWTDLNGKPQKRSFSGFAATVIQHEVDHLDGMLFTQRALSQGKKLYREINGELEEYEI